MTHGFGFYGRVGLPSLLALVSIALFGFAEAVLGQETGGVTGVVTEAQNGVAVSGITITVEGSTTAAVTGEDGRYVLSGLRAGTNSLRFAWYGYASEAVTIEVPPGGVLTLDVALEPNPIVLGEILVTSASRQPERVVTAPAAVSVPDPLRIQDLAVSGQTPSLLADLPGVHAPQSGIFDFNVNARGFNSVLNRRLLVLVDGRDPSVPLSNNLDWPAIQVLEDDTKVELIRGPGSALYGANAFSGVLNIISPSVREAQGTRVRVGGGAPTALRVDGRHALVTEDLRWGVRVTGGWNRTDSWDRSRTDLQDLENEYAQAFGANPPALMVPDPGYDLAPLIGQTKEGMFGFPGAALGDPDPITGYYGSGRVDHYLESGGMITGEGGFSQYENYVVTTTTGRSQITEVARPWARLAWADDDFNVQAYYTGRTGEALALATATPGPSDGSTLHGEAQFNRRLFDDQLRVVLGGSARRTSVSTDGEVLAVEQDNRADEYFAGYGQVEFEPHSKIKLIFAGRVDDGNLLDLEFSPKAGIVISPTPDQALRFTVNRAFLTPSALQRFLRFPFAPPADFSLLELGLRDPMAFGPFLAGVPDGELFTNSAAVPLLVIGNEELAPEKVTGFEVGYKAQLGRVFLSADAYYSEIEDFNTGALPGANPGFVPWTAPEAVPEPVRGPLEDAVIGQVGPALTRLPDGTTAVVLSLGNAGQATEWGVELGAGVQVSELVRLDGNYTHYDFSLDQDRFLPGDSILPNTPSNTVNLAATYQDPEGLRIRAGLRIVSKYDFLGGVFQGEVPASQSVDLNIGYRVTDSMRLDVTGSNVFDQQRFHVFGGSLVGRRLLASLTWDR